jgi:hypothetical protein
MAKKRHSGHEGHTQTSQGKGMPYTAEQHAQQVDQVMTPPTQYNDPRENSMRSLPDPAGGAMWGTQQPTPALGADTI